jgi:hypothetical protein
MPRNALPSKEFEKGRWYLRPRTRSGSLTSPFLYSPFAVGAAEVNHPRLKPVRLYLTKAVLLWEPKVWRRWPSDAIARAWSLVIGISSKTRCTTSRCA